jgi:hypothetical protein
LFIAGYIFGCKREAVRPPLLDDPYTPWRHQSSEHSNTQKIPCNIAFQTDITLMKARARVKLVADFHTVDRHTGHFKEHRRSENILKGDPYIFLRY